MEDIPLKRIVRLYLATFIVLIFVANVLSNEARAETGTINIDSETNIAAYSVSAPGADTAEPTMAKFNFDVASYNYVSSLWIVLPSGTSMFKLPSNYSYFTCASGCTGSGYVSYNKAGVIINWDFAGGFLVTSSPFTLTYETNIFDSTNFAWGSTVTSSTYTLSSTTPWSISNPSNNDVIHRGSATWQYNATLRTISTEYYDVNYAYIGGSTKFYVNINKTNNIAIQNWINKSSGAYAYETTFTATDWNSPVLEYDEGIIIKALLSNGDYEEVTVNNTGIPVTPPNCYDCVGYYTNNTNGSGIVNYSLAFVDFDVDNYHNNSDFFVKFGVRFVINNSYKSRYSNDLTWLVNVIDPEGIKISSYNILMKCEQKEDWWTTIIYNPLDWSCVNVQPYNSFFVEPPLTNWSNGTYTAQLTEYVVSSPYVLDTDTAGVLNTSGFKGIGSGGSGSGIGGAGQAVQGADIGTGIYLLVTGWFGNSPATLFIISIVIIIVTAYMMLKATKVPMFAAGGSVLATGVCVQLAFLPMIWGVMFVILTAFTFVKMLKQGM